MMAFVFSLVLLLGVILIWSFKRLFRGSLLTFEGAVTHPVRSALGARARGVGGPGAHAGGDDGRVAPPVRPAAASHAPQAAPAPISAVSASGAAASATPAAASPSPAPQPAFAAAPNVSAVGGAANRTPAAASPTSDAQPAPAAHAAGSSLDGASGRQSAPGTASPAPHSAVSGAGGKDDLRRMVGIGPTNERHLNGLGITTFAQIAAWTPEDVRRVEAVLAFDGRIARERWVEQAKYLAAGDQEGFVRAFPAAARGGNT